MSLFAGIWEERTFVKSGSFCQIIPRDLSTKRSVLHGREGWAVFQTLSIYGNWARPPLIATTILCWCAVMRLLCRHQHFYGCVNIHSYQGTGYPGHQVPWGKSLHYVQYTADKYKGWWGISVSAWLEMAKVPISWAQVLLGTLRYNSIHCVAM